jgi:hypothetical protein
MGMPRWVRRIRPSSAKVRASVRTGSIRPRQSDGLSPRATSDGQMVDVGERERSRDKILSLSASGDCSGQDGGTLSPCLGFFISEGFAFESLAGPDLLVPDMFFIELLLMR